MGDMTQAQRQTIIQRADAALRHQRGTSPQRDGARHGKREAVTGREAIKLGKREIEFGKHRAQRQGNCAEAGCGILLARRLSGAAICRGRGQQIIKMRGSHCKGQVPRQTPAISKPQREQRAIGSGVVCAQPRCILGPDLDFAASRSR